MGYDAFNPETNFHDPFNLAEPERHRLLPRQRRRCTRPAATLVGGFGVSGDGVDQDDVVTFAGVAGLRRAAERSCGPTRSFVRGVRLPYQKFNRNPQD